MKKGAFINIMDALQRQVKRNEKFADKIRKAYIEAGECEDFREANAYYPPTDKMMDRIIQGLAMEMSNKNHTYEQSLDLINWFVYEQDFGESIEIAIKKDWGSFQEMENEPVSAAYYMRGDKKIYCRNAAELYDALMMEMCR